MSIVKLTGHFGLSFFLVLFANELAFFFFPLQLLLLETESHYVTQTALSSPCSYAAPWIHVSPFVTSLVLMKLNASPYLRKPLNSWPHLPGIYLCNT
jgi:hypothetical protein